MPARWVERGGEQLAAGRWDAAIAAFLKAIAADPTRLEAWTGLARGYAGQRRLSAAVDAWRHATILAPDARSITIALADALRACGCLLDALEAYQSATDSPAAEHAPGDPHPLGSERRDHGNAFFGQAEALRLLGRPWAALDSYDSALSAYGWPVPPPEETADVARTLFGKAEALEAVARWNEAVALWGQVLAVDAANTLARTRLETARQAAREVPDPPAVPPSSESGPPPDPQRADRLLAWARALVSDQRHSEAQNALREVVALRPDWTDARVDLARSLEASEDANAALVEWTHLLEREPDRVEARSARGEILRKAQRWPEAIPAYQEALALDPDHVQALAGLGESLRLAGRVDEAIPLLERALSRRPTHVLALNGLAAALLSQDRHREARVFFERALALDPTSEAARAGLSACPAPEAPEHPPVVAAPTGLAADPARTRALNHLQMARSLLQQGRFADVAAAADRAIAEDPTWGAPWILLGVARTEERQFRAALSAFDEALRRDPGSVDAAVHRAEALRKNDDHAAAIEACDAILAVVPDQTHALLCRAEALRMLGRFSEAIAGFDRVLALDPTSWAGKCGKAAALNGLGRYAEALPLWEDAWRDNPNAFVERGVATCRAGLDAEEKRDPAALPARALVRRGKAEQPPSDATDEAPAPRGVPQPPDTTTASGRRPNRQRARDDLDRGRSFYKDRAYSAAISWFEKALQADPGFAEAAVRLGMALEDDRQYRRAIEAYQRCLAIDPKQYQAACNIGEAYRKHEKYEEAIKAYDNALALQADYLYALAGRAECMRMLGDYEGSLHWFDKALAVGPRHAFAIQGKAAALNSLGRWSEALPLWNAALEIDPQSPFAREGKAQAEAQVTQRPAEKAAESATPLLDEQGRDLTALARAGKLAPVIGREVEVRAVLKTLVRRLKANPLLLGEPGVGKTAVVEAVAQRIASDDAPFRLRGKRVVELSIGSLVAGTKYRGTFEERLKEIVKEARDNPGIIIFIDEIHTLVGAGRTEGGALDAANMLKPALARGEITVIGATTRAEYRKHFENDSALERRFQPIEINEPSAADTVTLLENLAERYEAHHGVTVAPEALRACVALSVRFVPERRLPDKALDLLDEACSETSLSDRGVVTEQVVAEVISEKTGIPLADLTTAERERLSGLERHLREQVVGQETAISELSSAVRLARSGLRDPKRPRGVFLFAGSSGVGKTALAKALSDFLFPEGNALLKLDMSEYSEKFTGSRLIGAPPGYAGHGEEGQLTGPLRKQPYTVVLLDEFEKAHADVQAMFLSLFDEGRITDSEGRKIHARDAFFIVTTNAGSDDPRKSRLGFSADTPEARRAEALERLRRSFRPELVNRVDSIVVFNDLTVPILRQVAALHLEALRRRAAELRLELSWEDEVVERCVPATPDPTLGARPTLRNIEDLVTAPLGRWLLDNPEDSNGWREVRAVVRAGQVHLETGAVRPGQVQGRETSASHS